MEVLKLAPAFKDYLWGGEAMCERFGYRPQSLPLAEAWVLSCHKDGPSIVENGVYKGLTLTDAIEKEGRECLGTKGKEFSFFPILIKLIDARQNLSVQVHPDDAYALRHENEYGKTEMWYILDCSEGAYLYYGFKRQLTKAELAAHIKAETLTDLLQKVYVKKGDCLMIEAGTVHAIGAGILLAEIQQNSNTTYRVYDYGRRDKNGNTRPLHIEQATEVATLAPAAEPVRNILSDGILAGCRYFTSALAAVEGERVFNVDGESFRSYLCIEGNCRLGGIELSAGECVFVPAGMGEIRAVGSCKLIESGV